MVQASRLIDRANARGADAGQELDRVHESATRIARYGVRQFDQPSAAMHRAFVAEHAARMSGLPEATVTARLARSLLWRDQTWVQRSVQILRIAQENPRDKRIFGVAQVVADHVRQTPRPRGRSTRAAQELAKFVARFPSRKVRHGRPRKYTDEALEEIDRTIEELFTAGVARSRRQAIIHLPDLVRPGKRTPRQKLAWSRLVPGLQRALVRYRKRVREQ